MRGQRVEHVDSSAEAGHILRKVYNCTERKNFRPPNIKNFSGKKISMSYKFSTTFFPFFSHFPKQFWLSSSKFTTVQLRNSHFTTANYILQLHKLSSVARKICPVPRLRK